MAATKYCLVTGASSGIGKHIAMEMASRGWKVIAVARRGNELNKLATDKIIPMVCDVSNPGQVKEISEKLLAKKIIPSLFYLNAGDGDTEDENFNLELHKKTFETNYFGTMNWIDQWIPILIKNGGGRFVGTSSLQSYVALPGSAAYGSSKAALNYTFESLDAMHYKNNIRFALIYPGPVDTPMLKTDKPIKSAWKPEKAAKYIVQKVLKGKMKIKFPPRWVVIVGIGKRLPRSFFRVK